MHGGAAPQTKAAAARRTALVEAETYVAEQVAARGPLTLADVYDELITTATLAVQWRDVLQQRVDALTEWRYTATGAGTEQLRAELALYERALDRTAKVLDLIARLDLDTRATALAHRQADAVIRVIEQALAAAQLTTEQDNAARAALPRLLRALTKEAL